ncbi:MAG: molybdenum ABC transporter ATP-binding protein [Candidatus Protistobacter heckmanni]|nr:molybdenum ABC transporter ATP-binding protein [Candidatus Protistobacter heckmanni]
MIEFDFSRRVGDFQLQVQAVLPAVGVTAVFGRSGAGKSTLVDAVAGAVRPDAGRIVVGGETFFDADLGVDLPPQRRAIGYVFQDARLFPHLNVRANLFYGHKRALRQGRDQGIAGDHVIALLGLESLLARRPGQLSGGERQRVGIGRALLAQPRLLLMDEPLASLDAARKAEILPYIERLREEIALPVLYISHAIDEVVRLADHMVLLEGGKVLRYGALGMLMADPELGQWIGRSETGAVLACTVLRHEEALGMTVLGFADGELRLPRLPFPERHPPGARLRLRIRARDVALALEQPQGLSISNQLAGVVADMAAVDAGHVDVGVVLPSGAVMRALVMRDSVNRLGLEIGRPVWALVKAAAIAG